MRTLGAEHWALTSDGVVHWTGSSLDPPPPETHTPQATTPPAPARLTLAPATDTPSAGDAGDWLDNAVTLIHTYDRTHGTVLGSALARTRIVVLHIPGAWAAFVPSARTITLDPVLETESQAAVVTVLAHEAQHAVDQLMLGGATTEVACYSYEVSAFRLEAVMWQSLFGPGGNPDPHSALERELNEILLPARSRTRAA